MLSAEIFLAEFTVITQAVGWDFFGTKNLEFFFDSHR
jgi:hypothetical protein